MINASDTTPKLRNIRPVRVDVGVAKVALGNLAALGDAEVDRLLECLADQLLQDYPAPKIFEYLFAQDVVANARRLWQCAVRDFQKIDPPLVALKCAGMADRLFWKAVGQHQGLAKARHQALAAASG